MSKKEEVSIPPISPREAYANLLLKHGACMYRAFKLRPEADKRAIASSFVLGASATTCGAIVELSSDPRFNNECFMLARGLFERLLNASYLLYCDEPELEKFLAFPIYKAVMKTNRVLHTGSLELALTFSGRDTLLEDEVVKKAMALFHPTREVRNWTTDSSADKIALIADRGKVKEIWWALPKMIIEEDASEALHGSFYGLVFHTGFYTPGANADPLNEDKSLVLLFHSISELIGETLKLLDRFLPLGGILDDSKVIRSFGEKELRSAFERFEPGSSHHAFAEAFE